MKAIPLILALSCCSCDREARREKERAEAVAAVAAAKEKYDAAEVIVMEQKLSDLRTQAQALTETVRNMPEGPQRKAAEAELNRVNGEAQNLADTIVAAKKKIP